MTILHNVIKGLVFAMHNVCTSNSTGIILFIQLRTHSTRYFGLSYGLAHTSKYT